MQLLVDEIQRTRYIQQKKEHTFQHVPSLYCGEDETSILNRQRHFVGMVVLAINPT